MEKQLFSFPSFSHILRFEKLGAFRLWLLLPFLFINMYGIQQTKKASPKADFFINYIPKDITQMEPKTITRARKIA